MKTDAGDDWTTPVGPGWSSGAPREVYRNPWIVVEESAATAPTGAPATYGVVRFQNQAIAVLPLFDDGTTVLVGQHRFAFAEYSWEIPEGGAPLGEAPLDGAKRELLEETGLAAAEWRQVLELQLSNAVTDERAYGFLAVGLSEGRAAPDETEALTLRRVPFAQALRLATTGVIKDVLTVAMLLRAYHMASTRELPAPLCERLLAR